MIYKYNPSKKYVFFMFALALALIFCTFSYAVEVTDATKAANAGPTGADANLRGVVFKVYANNTRLLEVKQYNGDTTPIVYLYKFDGVSTCELLAQANFNSTYQATFRNVSVILNTTTLYLLETGTNGGNFLYSTGGAAYPLERTNINFTDRAINCGGAGDERVYSIDTVTTEVSGGAVANYTASFTSPPDADRDSINLNINVSCSTTPANFTLYFNVTKNPIIITRTNTNFLNWTMNLSLDGSQDGQYNYSANCGGANVTQSFVLDTLKASITINPNNFFTSTNGSTVTDYTANTNLTINITVTHHDPFLYGFLFNMTHPNGTVMFSYQNETLINASSGASFNFTRGVNFSNFQRGVNYSITVSASDAHTDFFIPAYSNKLISNGISFTPPTTKEIKIYSIDDAAVVATKLRDRYNFDFTFVNKELTSRTFYVESQSKIDYIPSQKYKGWFVIGGMFGNWLDFENEAGDVTVTKINANKYQIVVTGKDKIGEILFKSLGGLNVETKNFVWYLPYIPNQTTSITSESGTPSILDEDNMLGNVYDYCPYSNCTIIFNWYKNGVLNKTENRTFYTDIISGSYTNISKNFTTVGHNWTLSQGIIENIYAPNFIIWQNSSTVTITDFFLDNCSTYTTYSLNISYLFFDNSLANVNVSANIVYYYASTVKNYTLHINYVNRTNFCISPAFINLTSNISITAYGYANKLYSYYAFFSPLNNNTRNINLYVDSETTSDVTATVFDQIQRTTENVYIYVLKYDSSTGNYVNVGIYKTNFEGQVKIPLILNTQYYKFLLYYPATTLVKTTTPTYVYSSTINFQIIIGEDVLENYIKKNNIFSNLSYNPVTFNFKHDYSDSSAQVTSACLYVYIVGQTNVLNDSSCISGASGTILIPISNISGYTYLAKSTVYIDGTEYPMDSLTVNFPSSTTTQVISYMGIIIDVILTIAFAFIITFSIPLGVIMIPLPTIFFAFIGFIAVDPMIAIGLEVAALVVAIIINSRG